MMNDRWQIGIRDFALAIMAGAIAFFAVQIWGVPGVDPSMWDEIAAVSGVRPPRGIFPGLWRLLTGWLFWLFGTSAAIAILKFVGSVGAGLCTMLVCLIARQVLALLIRTSHPFPVWYRRIAPFFAFLGAFFFGIGEPLANAAQIFTPDLLRLLMLLASVHLSLRWLVNGGRWRLFPAMVIMGLLASETAFGFALPFVLVRSYMGIWWCVMDGLFPKPEKLAEPSELPKWRMFFLFLGGLGLGIWLNGAQFIFLGGAEANGWSTADVYFRYATGYWYTIRHAASLIGWVLGLGFCVFPLVLGICLFPTLARDDRPMPFACGAPMFFIGILALMQTGVIPVTRFWSFSSVEVYSGFLLAFFNFCAMVTVSLFGAAFAFECQRTYLNADEELPVQPPGLALRGLAPFIGLVLAVAAVFSVPNPVETEMQSIVDAAIEETVRECENVKWLFTDGRLDAGVELEAKRQGKELKTLNMMSGASKWEVNVRCRGFEPGSPDYTAAATGIPSLLRIWAGEKVNGMDGVGLQLGFEFWKREQKTLPKASGMVAIEKGLDDATAEQGIQRAKAIADRILAIADKAAKANPSPALASAFSAVNWLISRFARLRNEVDVAKGLDRANTDLQRMLLAVEIERQRTFMHLTPLEGLEIALRRANYAEARRYAAAVMQNDPDDPQANFAMGMDALMNKKYEEAQRYLEKVLKRRPKEPAVLNNLSIVCRKQRKYKEAEDYARRAVDVLPGSPEVQGTLKDALKKAP